MPYPVKLETGCRLLAVIRWIAGGDLLGWQQEAVVASSSNEEHTAQPDDCGSQKRSTVVPAASRKFRVVAVAR